MSQESNSSTTCASAEGTEMIPQSELAALVEVAVERAMSVRANPETVAGELCARTWLQVGRYGCTCVTVGIWIVPSGAGPQHFGSMPSIQSLNGILTVTLAGTGSSCATSPTMATSVAMAASAESPPTSLALSTLTASPFDQSYSVNASMLCNLLPNLG